MRKYGVMMTETRRRAEFWHVEAETQAAAIKAAWDKFEAEDFDWESAEVEDSAASATEVKDSE